MERLENYIKQIRGISYSPKDISDIKKADYVPILKANNIQENGLDLSNLIYIHKSKVKKEQFIKKGDLLLAASSGSKEIVGKNIFFSEDFEGTFGAFCKIVRPNNKINSKYLSAFFKTPNYKRHIKKVIQGANINNLKNDDIDSLEIPVFNEGDQIYISEILSQANNLIQQRKKSIDLLDDFLKSTFLEMFGDPVRNDRGWNELELKKCTSKIGSGATPRGGKEIYKSEGISLIRSLNIYDNEFKYENLAFINDEQAEKLKNVEVHSNDVLFNITGASICRCSVVPKDVLPARVNQHVSIIRTKSEKLNPKFLSNLLISDNVKKKLLGIGSYGGAIMQAITKDQLQSFKVIIPPIEIQNKFALIVEKIESLKKEYITSLNELENLYGFLSQKAFKGELLNKNLMISEASEDYIKWGNKIDEVQTAVAGSLEPPKEEDKIPKVFKEEINQLKKNKEKSKPKIDITNLSIADFYGVPFDIQSKRENIDFDFIGDDLFYQFLLKDHFKDESFTSQDLFEKLHNHFYHNGNMDFDNEKWKNIIFQFLDANPPLLEQIYDENDNTVKLKLTDEAYKA